MYRRSLTRLGLLSTFVGELKKLPAYLSYKAQKGATAYVNSASETIEFLKGENVSESPEMREKRRRHKEMYQAILNEQAAKAAAEKAKLQQARAQLSWRERLQLSMKESKEALQQMTSTRAGVMAVLQHCTASHAAEVAIEQGIDVKNVQMVFEKVAAKNAVGFEEVVVGYIDAPAASQEEVMAFAEKLHKACPVANTMHIEWRQGHSDKRDRDGGDGRRAAALQDEMERAARQVDWEAGRSGGHGQSGSSPQPTVSDIPIGMPGARRVYQAATRRANSGFGDEDDAFHLPGVKKPNKDAASSASPATFAESADQHSERSGAEATPSPPSSKATSKSTANAQDTSQTSTKT